jgi:hypothetical protein
MALDDPEYSNACWMTSLGDVDYHELLSDVSPVLVGLISGGSLSKMLEKTLERK